MPSWFEVQRASYGERARGKREEWNPSLGSEDSGGLDGWMLKSRCN